jgi:hypothetical protein
MAATPVGSFPFLATLTGSRSAVQMFAGNAGVCAANNITLKTKSVLGDSLSNEETGLRTCCAADWICTVTIDAPCHNASFR